MDEPLLKLLRRSRLTPFAVLSFCWVIGIGVVGCRAPIGADRTSTRMAYEALTDSAITLEMSDASRRVLHRYDLTAEFSKQPEEALLDLHQRAVKDERRDVLFALAELNYLHGEELHRSPKAWEPSRAPDFFLGAAVYSWFYLLGEGEEPPPTAYDRRFRVACDIYNRAVARAFSVGPRTNTIVRVQDEIRELPQGAVNVELVVPDFEWDIDRIRAFLPADDFTVRGLTVRDRQSGLGAPLIGVQQGAAGEGFLRPVPITLLLDVPGNISQWSKTGLEARLELFSTYEVSEVTVGGQVVPLELDTTAPLAYSLNDDFIWDLGFAQFFSYEEKLPSRIYTTQPYAPGRIPVIFVHGTFSSPVWWAEMWNTLRNDSALRDKYQFWYFVYNSGNPVLYSAAKLRDGIEAQIQEFDPEGRDPALQRMVVIGHSQGGLLTKLTATDTGDALWRVHFSKDPEEMDFEPEVLERIRRYAFFEALPSVERVVFISTPHRGSFLANRFVRQLSRRFMSLPGDVAEITENVIYQRNQEELPREMRRGAPTSPDQMSPKNELLLTLAEIPVADSVTAHSIIPVKSDGPSDDADDGVVKYTSAHVTYVDSELILPNTGHGCQAEPQTIEEVRRILLEHLDSAGASDATDH